jgi:hypothetical protein
LLWKRQGLATREAKGGRMKKQSIAKRIVGIGALALVSSWVVLVSAAPRQIDIEPEQCTTRCYYIMGVPILCYEMCY